MWNEPLITVVMKAWLQQAQDSDSKDDSARSPPGTRLPEYNLTRDGLPCSDLPKLTMTARGFYLADSERAIRRDVKRYFGGAREVQFLLLKDTELQKEMNAAGCKSISTRTISRIRDRFLWYVQRYTEKNRQWACCPECSGVDFKARRLSRLTSRPFTSYSLTEMRCCKYETVHFGPAAGGHDKEIPRAECLRGTCDACRTRNWMPTLSPIEENKQIRWTEYKEYTVLAPSRDESGEKVMKDKKKLREAPVAGTGRKLLDSIDQCLQCTPEGIFPHLERVIWQHHSLKAKRSVGFCVRLDYGSRIGIGGEADPLATGINPDQIGNLNVVVDRAWDSVYDKDRPRPADGRMQDRTSILFDYIPGRDHQNADSTEAGLWVLLFRYVLLGFTTWEDAIYVHHQ